MHDDGDVVLLAANEDLQKHPAGEQIQRQHAVHVRVSGRPLPVDERLVEKIVEENQTENQWQVQKEFLDDQTKGVGGGEARALPLFEPKAKENDQNEVQMNGIGQEQGQEQVKPRDRVEVEIVTDDEKNGEDEPTRENEEKLDRTNAQPAIEFREREHRNGMRDEQKTTDERAHWMTHRARG